jgi:hypothetical protein
MFERKKKNFFLNKFFKFKKINRILFYHLYIFILQVDRETSPLKYSGATTICNTFPVPA